MLLEVAKPADTSNEARPLTLDEFSCVNEEQCYHLDLSGRVHAWFYGGEKLSKPKGYLIKFPEKRNWEQEFLGLYKFWEFCDTGSCL